MRYCREVKMMSMTIVMTCLLAALLALSCSASPKLDVYTADAEQQLPDFDAMWDYDRPAETEKQLRELLPAAESSGNTMYALELKTQIARTLGLQSKFDEGHAILDTVEKCLQPNLKRVRVRYLLERGRMFNSSDHPDKAKPLFIEAWDLGRSAHEEDLAVDAAHMVAIVEKGKASELWSNRALDYAETCKDKKARAWRASLYNNLGWTYHDEGRYEEALATFRKALKAHQENGRPEPTRIARWTIARCLRSLGRVKEALAMQQDQVKIFDSQHRPYGAYVCEEMAECLYALGQKKDSRPWFEKAYASLSKDDWLVSHEAARIARLKLLSL